MTWPSTPMRSPTATSTRSPTRARLAARRRQTPSASITATLALPSATICSTEERARPRATIEIAADQQEEQQRDRRIEIGVLAGIHRLEQAHARDQADADGDRHVHVGAAGRKGCQRRAEERPAGIGDGRQCDQRREPVHQVAGRDPHALDMARPHRDREQHDIAGGEPGHRHRAQQFALARVADRRHAAERHQAEAERRHAPREARRLRRAAPPFKRQAPRGEVDARLEKIGLARQHGSRSARRTPHRSVRRPAATARGARPRAPAHARHNRPPARPPGAARARRRQFHAAHKTAPDPGPGRCCTPPRTHDSRSDPSLPASPRRNARTMSPAASRGAMSEARAVRAPMMRSL